MKALHARILIALGALLTACSPSRQHEILDRIQVQFDGVARAVERVHDAASATVASEQMARCARELPLLIDELRAMGPADPELRERYLPRLRMAHQRATKAFRKLTQTAQSEPDIALAVLPTTLHLEKLLDDCASATAAPPQ